MKTCNVATQNIKTFFVAPYLKKKRTNSHKQNYIKLAIKKCFKVTRTGISKMKGRVSVAKPHFVLIWPAVKKP